MRSSALVGLLTAGNAAAEVLKVGDFAQGAEFTKCIKITDFNTKSLSDDVEVIDRADGGCCSEGYIPGIEHSTKYWGAMVVCGFQDDGSVALSTSSSNGTKTCTYNKCYVVKMDITCADKSKMTLDGCCPKDQNAIDCDSKTQNTSFFSEKVEYCLSYQKKSKLEGTSNTTDDQVTVDGVTSLSLTNLTAYTACKGGFGNGSAAEEVALSDTKGSTAEEVTLSNTTQLNNFSVVHHTPEPAESNVDGGAIFAMVFFLLATPAGLVGFLVWRSEQKKAQAAKYKAFDGDLQEQENVEDQVAPLAPVHNFTASPKAVRPPADCSPLPPPGDPAPSRPLVVPPIKALAPLPPAEQDIPGQISVDDYDDIELRSEAASSDAPSLPPKPKDEVEV